MSLKKERLQKVIAQSGITSRRKAEQFILDKRVKVNGETVTELGTKVSENDTVEVDNIPIEKESLTYYIVNKPRKYISSVKDDRGRRVVTELVPDRDVRVFPIGRLDFDTSGLIILTNDGELAQLMMHPRHEIDKVYLVKVKGIPPKAILNEFLRGVQSKGEELTAKEVKLLSANKQKNSAIIEVTLQEGKNRQVRRMFEEINFPVAELTRVRYSFLDLTGLEPGEYRELSNKEVRQLKAEAVIEDAQTD